MTRIKICGNTRRTDVEIAVDLGVDLLGFIFAQSPRQISIENARLLVEGIPDSVERVGVFIDEPTELIQAAVEACGLTAVQLYRPINLDDRRLSVTFLPAVRVRQDQILREDGFQPADRPLLDTWSAGREGGGSGNTWDWERAGELARRQSIIVSGGLNPVNVAEAIERLRPWGVDVCSGVEAGPGVKDPQKLRAFVLAVRGAGPTASSGSP